MTIELEKLSTMTTTPARHSRSLAVGLVAVLIAALSLVPGTASGKSAPNHFKLNAGQAKFWNGEYIAEAHLPDPALCAVARCPEYTIEVNEDSSRLRVALSAIFKDPGDVRFWADPPVDPATIFDVQVKDPKGEVVSGGSTQELTTAHAVEVFVPNPVKGTYTVTVIPKSVIDMAFRMRAKLEEKPAATDPTAPPTLPTLLKPNLRVVPPFEFNFYTPTVTYGPGTPTPAASCMAEEVEEAIGAKLTTPEVCLRYSLGFENAGEGRLDLDWDGLDSCWLFASRDPASSPTECTLTQRLWLSDGNSKFVDPVGSAGSAIFHATHGHWHYQNVYEAQLFAVADGQLGTTPLGDGRKFGVQPGSEKMADWRRFWPACGPAKLPAKLSNSCQHDRDFKGEGTIELQAGWGDIYEWNRSGNYVPFPHADRVPTEGRYVLRVETDPLRKIIESDETDNLGYAYIEVATDGSVDLIERGYGSDPWDPSKKILEVTP